MPEETIDLTVLARREICSLCISPTLRGYHFLVYLVEQVAREPMRIRSITKDLYPEAAHHFNTNWKTAERNSRTAVIACWRDPDGKKRLCELAGHQLTERPRTAAFIAIVAAHAMYTHQRKT